MSDDEDAGAGARGLLALIKLGLLIARAFQSPAMKLFAKLLARR